MPIGPQRFVILTRRLLASISGIGQALKEQTAAITESIEAAKPKQKIPEEVNAEVHVSGPIETRKNANDASGERKYQCLTLVISTLTLIAVIAYAWLAYLQWQEMIGATNATADAVREARRSRGLSERSFLATVDQFRLDQRAWVGVGMIAAHPESFHVGDDAAISVSFKNTGKTPARNMLLTLVKDPLPKGIPPKFSYQGEKVARYGLLPPN